MLNRLRLPALALSLLVLAVGTTSTAEAWNCNDKICIERNGGPWLPNYGVCWPTDPNSGPRTKCIPTNDGWDCGWDWCDPSPH